MNRPHTNWLCTCGCKLKQISRHLMDQSSVNYIRRCYSCRNTTCNKLWISEEKMQLVMVREPKG